ncbi:MAG TPA: xanthine dehydrogenase family protein molybdopterin-binding subunit [Caulobacteraceae bacterium]|jgi:xanthine dehydrogenase YagR molybdenum-binding subunit
MEMNAPVGATPLDNKPDGVVGKPLDRVEGALKVTGRATYAAEYAGQGKVLYGFIVQAPIGKGRITSMDTRAAEAAPGVVLVMTAKNAPKLQPRGQSGSIAELQDDQIVHYGQAVGLVVADSYEAARAGAYLVKAQYDRQAAPYELKTRIPEARTPTAARGAPDTSLGDFDGAFATAPVKIDALYTTPHQIHSAMEPHATIAQWQGDQLVLHTSNQMLNQGQASVGATFGIPADQVRLVSRYVGGGFGSKLQVWPDAILAAMAARVLNRPVKIVDTRQQLPHLNSHRTATVQRVRLGADRQGKILAIGHDSWSATLVGDAYHEAASNQTRSLYAGANRETKNRVVEVNLPQSGSMRAPGEAVGLLALECAMDELATALEMDPIELRVRNEPTEDPERHVPFSSRNLIPCMRAGAERFGWARRNPRPGQVRDGDWLVGMGMAAAIRGNPLRPSSASVTLGSDGVLTCRMAMTDIGTGTYTIMTQIAAEMMGLPMERVHVLMGDTNFPKASGSGGSFGANSAGSALYVACMNLRAKLASAAGVPVEGAEFAEGSLRAGGRSWDIRQLAGSGLSADGDISPGEMETQYSQQSFGAHFAEVGVNADTGEIRMRRMLGVFTIGRVLNEKTARSQGIGGMIMGVGAALMEEGVVDPRFGNFVNNDLAGYHVPVDADIAELDAFFLPELDNKSSPMKSKGAGEVAICGAGAAVANAVYNACGVRIRDYPLTLDKVLAGFAKA